MPHRTTKQNPGRWFLLPVLLILLPALGAATEAHPNLSEALDRLYNFDFPGAHAVLDRHIGEHPGDPLGPGLRAATYLFYELDRLAILESEFFADDKRIAEQRRLIPDPDVREKLEAALEQTGSLALAVLEQKPDDKDALFAMCIQEGVRTDYKALVEKKQLRSLSNAKAANRFAMRLLAIDPTYYDAYLTTGINEYLVGSLPFFVKWFVRMDGVEGSKKRGVLNLETVAEKGRYFRPFAKILLAIIQLREKNPGRARELLAELQSEYPRNPLIAKELNKITQKLATGELSNGGAR